MKKIIVLSVAIILGFMFLFTVVGCNQGSGNQSTATQASTVSDTKAVVDDPIMLVTGRVLGKTYTAQIKDGKIIIKEYQDLSINKTLDLYNQEFNKIVSMVLSPDEKILFISAKVGLSKNLINMTFNIEIETGLTDEVYFGPNMGNGINDLAYNPSIGLNAIVQSGPEQYEIIRMNNDCTTLTLITGIKGKDGFDRPRLEVDSSGRLFVYNMTNGLGVWDKEGNALSLQ